MADPMSICLSVLEFLYTLVYGIYCVLESIVIFFLPRDYRRKDIKGQIVLVTGGGSGIGRHMCLKFAEKGAKIVTWDINTAGNEETVRQVVDAGGKCHGYTVNLCNRNEIYETAKKVKQEIGKVDILVNNAGIVSGTKFLESKDESIIRTFEVNTFSHFWTAKAFLGDMIKDNKGHIVTIASMAGWIGANGLVDYCSSKFATVGFDESLRLELKVEGATNVKTTVVCPIAINTGMFQGIGDTIYPMLTPEWVAAEAVDATLMDEPIVMLPKHTRLSVMMKFLLPEKLLYKLAQQTGVTSMMDSFVGRRKAD